MDLLLAVGDVADTGTDEGCTGWDRMSAVEKEQFLPEMLSIMISCGDFEIESGWARGRMGEGTDVVDDDEMLGAGVGRGRGAPDGGAELGRTIGTGVNFSGGIGGNGTARRGTLGRAVGTMARGGRGWPEGSEKLDKISVGMDGDFNLGVTSGLPLPFIQADWVLEPFVSRQYFMYLSMSLSWDGAIGQ